MFWWQIFSEYWAFARKVWISYTAVWSDRWHSIRSPFLECNKISVCLQINKMTISYGQQVATSSGLGVFWKLLFLWRGSIYKLVWTNLALYIFLYYSLSLTYRFLLDEGGRVRLPIILPFVNYHHQTQTLIRTLVSGKVWASIPSLSKVRRLDSGDICSWFLC